jgi:thiamine biosynthesis protein ThiI
VTPAVFVLRLGEIFLKKGNRPMFVERLGANVKRALAGMDGVAVHYIHARMMVEVAPAERERAAERLARVFGVQSFSPVTVCEKSFDALRDEAVRVAKASAGGAKSFRVEAVRSDKSFPVRSMDMGRDIGGAIFVATGLRVDLHHPDLVVGIEVGVHHTFVFAQTIAGPGGLPVGTGGRANLLLSGGIDSPVAGWLGMKRGLVLDATYFHAFPFTGDKTKEKVVDLARLLTPWHGPIELSVVAFAEAQKALRAAGPAELAVVLYRRMMLRTAADIARRQGAAALVTGDSLGQVASQTLENLATIDEASPLLVLRPLLCYDKLETMSLAKRIGTFETSIQPYDDCCSLFLAAHPSTRATLSQVGHVESKLDVAAMAIDLAERAERITVS